MTASQVERTLADLAFQAPPLAHLHLPNPSASTRFLPRPRTGEALTCPFVFSGYLSHSLVFSCAGVISRSVTNYRCGWSLQYRINCTSKRKSCAASEPRSLGRWTSRTSSSKPQACPRGVPDSEFHRSRRWQRRCRGGFFCSGS